MAQPPADRPRAGLRLMHVHAHPDDESSKGAASTAKYVAEGVDVHVVTCTGGERGSILNPKMDRPDVLENIAEIRRQEMDAAREILGVTQDWLGFVDSGFPEGDPPPHHIMCHKVAVAAFEAAGDPERYPDSGEPWQPLKLYYHHAFHRERTQALHDAMLAEGLESPY